MLVRNRLAVGFFWLFAGYLLIGHNFPKPSSATGVAADVYTVARFVTPVGLALALSVLAYLIGIVAFPRLRMPSSLPFSLPLGRVEAAVTELVVGRLADRLGGDADLRDDVVRATVASGQSRGIVIDGPLLDDLLRNDSELRQAAVRGALDTTEPVALERESLPGLASGAGPGYEKLCAERDFRAGMAAPLIVVVLTLAVRGSGWWLLALVLPALLIRAAIVAHQDAQLILVARSDPQPLAQISASVDSAWAWPAVRIVRALAVSPDATVVAGGTIDGRIHLWSTESGELIRTLAGHDREVSGLAFASDGRLLVSGGDDRTTRVWEVETGAEHQRLDHDEPVQEVAVNRDGVVVIGSPSSLTWWYRDAQRPSRVDLGSARLDQMALDPDSKLLAVALDDGSLRVYVGEIPVDLATYEDLTLVGWSGLNPFVAGFVKSGDAAELRGWDPLTGKKIHPGAVAPGGLSRPALARPHGTSVAVSNEDNQVLLLDVQSGAVAQTLTGHGESVTALAWPANGDVLVTSSADGTVVVWDVTDGRARLRLVPPG